MVISKKIEDLLKFVAFTQEFQKIKRVILKKDTEEWESDADHSWQLAIVAWYIIDQEKLHLDLQKVIRYSLIHDLVEVYAGDTYVFGTEEEKQSKQKREAQALVQLARDYPEFTELHKLIHEYEGRQSLESRFIYALDKLLPVMNVFLDNGRLWKRNAVTYQMARDNKDEKIAMSKEVEKYWKEFIQILEENKKRVFVD
jgi:putative hydrolase of HD superfamily